MRSWGSGAAVVNVLHRNSGYRGSGSEVLLHEVGQVRARLKEWKEGTSLCERQFIVRVSSCLVAESAVQRCTASRKARWVYHSPASQATGAPNIIRASMVATVSPDRHRQWYK